MPYGFNVSSNLANINILIKEFKTRLYNTLKYHNLDEGHKSPFISFAAKRHVTGEEDAWLKDNQERFFRLTPNENILKFYFLSELGYIFCMLYTPDGKYLIVGHSTGLIQIESVRKEKSRVIMGANTIQESSLYRHWSYYGLQTNPFKLGLVGFPFYQMDELNAILASYANVIQNYYENDHQSQIWYPLFYNSRIKQKERHNWVKQNYETFLKGTPNEILYNRWYHTDLGYITALEYAPNGSHIIVGHSSGLIQLHHGRTGTAMCTLRSVQFPPKPIYALEYSRNEERVCYASCMDGAVYRIEIPNLPDLLDDENLYGIRANPVLDCLYMQYYAAPGPSACSSPFITQRTPALSMGITADSSNMVVGYSDASIKVYDMETQKLNFAYKVHKLRLQFMPKKLQRIHTGQVCAIKCHDERPFVFASAAWDKTVRIWDIRSQIGCMMTFEGVDVCSNSIDLKRNYCLAGSWQPTEALTLWDIAAKKKVSIVRVQNRRPDVDGEYIYACRFWQSSKYNRKAKYGIIGGSGTNCVEVINLHNRYITCSYPAEGTVLAVTSHEDTIAFGGTAPVFNIVGFHDPKHEEYPNETESESFWQPEGDVVLYERGDNESTMSTEAEMS